MSFSIVVATKNPGKVRELSLLFAEPRVTLVPMIEVLPADFEVEETGATFEDNAWLKATRVTEATGLPALADDSGIEVDALGGRPGVHSARYAGPRATDAENNELLLRELAGVAPSDRTARFRCVLALAVPESTGPRRLLSAVGVVEGRILETARGEGGFGYDPLFAAFELGGRTTGEVPLEEKNRVSHRARAARELGARLGALLDARKLGG